MHNELCDIYGMDVPIFAFSHSPAVIAAVSKSGGFGVLGAAGMEPEELDQALKHISQECAGKAFGIDLIIPDNYVGSEQGGLTLEELQKHIPQGHRDFVAGLLDEYHCTTALDTWRSNFIEGGLRHFFEAWLAPG